jgi:hypothetical protein
MVAEAQQKRAELLQALGEERSSLQKKIDEMKTFERDYRVRLKSHLEGQLLQLEQIAAYEPAASDGGGSASSRSEVDPEKHADPAQDS